MSTFTRDSPRAKRGRHEAAALRIMAADEAVVLVDKHLGRPGSWPSDFIRHRLESDFLRDWKVEVGQWLKAAEDNSYLDALTARVLSRAKRRTRSDGVDPNDARKRELFAELAPAMTAYFLTQCGWRFTGWEPKTGGPIDVDLSLSTSRGTEVSLQVKAPDDAGYRANGRIVNGENDDFVLTAVKNGARQLNLNEGTNVIVICAQREWPLSSYPRSELDPSR